MRIVMKDAVDQSEGCVVLSPSLKGTKVKSGTRTLSWAGFVSGMVEAVANVTEEERHGAVTAMCAEFSK